MISMVRAAKNRASVAEMKDICSNVLLHFSLIVLLLNFSLIILLIFLVIGVLKDSNYSGFEEDLEGFIKKGHMDRFLQVAINISNKCIKKKGKTCC